MNEFLHLDLFSGIGGFSLAFEPEGFRTIAFCEHDEIKRIVLRHWWPGVPILPDVRDTAGIAEFCRPFGTIDLITGGVPCQPASALGQQRGTADERWLWPDTIRLVGAIRPRFAVFENPPALLTLEGGRAWNGIVSGLVALGYDCWWDVFPAAAFGAGHLRERVILTCADSSSRSVRIKPDNELRSGRDFIGGEGARQPASNLPHEKHGLLLRSNVRPGETQDSKTDGRSEIGVASNSDGEHVRSTSMHHRGAEPTDLRGRFFATEPGQPPWWHETHTGIPVLAHGIPNKLAEAFARCCGDSVVPQAIQPLAKAIKAALT